MTALKGGENTCYIYTLHMLSGIQHHCQTVLSLETSSAKPETSETVHSTEGQGDQHVRLHQLGLITLVNS